MTLTDLQAVSDLCREIEKERGCGDGTEGEAGEIEGWAKKLLHVCDSTFATPVICKPLDFGCDLVVQSLTKYYDGHDMTTGGSVISATKGLNERIKFVQNMHGNIMSPMVAFLLIQVRTFSLSPSLSYLHS